MTPEELAFVERLIERNAQLRQVLVSLLFDPHLSEAAKKAVADALAQAELRK